MPLPSAAPLTDVGNHGVHVLDRDARFRTFVGVHQDRAVRIAWRLLGGDDAAEDVAQEAFLRAYRGLHRFRDESSLEAWFYGILVNEARRYRRWRAVRLRWNALWEDDPPDPRPHADGDPGLRQRITAAIDKLSPGQREAFVLVYLEGFTLAQVALQLGKAEGTVKSHLHRALASLRGELRDIDPGLAGVGERQ